MSAGFHAAGATRERLTRTINAAASSAPHLKPVFEGVRDGGVHLLFVPQSATAFRMPAAAASKPRVVIIGDDFDQSMGPNAFHMPSLRRLIRAGALFGVVTASPEAGLYGSATLAAVLHRSLSVIVETRLEHELQWVELIQKLAPGRMAWLHTVEGGHA